MKTYRAWINQPSTLQAYHKMHGKRCIVLDDGCQVVQVWFTDGPIHSMMIDRSSLSPLPISSPRYD